MHIIIQQIIKYPKFYISGQYQNLKQAQSLINGYINTVDGLLEHKPNSGHTNVPQLVQAPNSNRPQPKTTVGARFGSYSEAPPIPKFGSYFNNGQQNIRQT